MAKIRRYVNFRDQDVAKALDKEGVIKYIEGDNEFEIEVPEEVILWGGKATIGFDLYKKQWYKIILIPTKSEYFSTPDGENEYARKKGGSRMETIYYTENK